MQQTNATTYLLSCPTTTNPSPRNVTDAGALTAPETVTANPTKVIVSTATSGTTVSYDCQYTGTTKPATCNVLLYVAAGQTVNFYEDTESFYAPNAITLQPVTVTAGNLTPEAVTATSTASRSGTSSGSSAATPKPTNDGVAVGLEGQATWAAVGAGFVGLAMGVI